MSISTNLCIINLLKQAFSSSVSLLDACIRKRAFPSLALHIIMARHSPCCEHIAIYDAHISNYYIPLYKPAQFAYNDMFITHSKRNIS